MDPNDLRIFCALAIPGPPEDITRGRPRGPRQVARDLGLDEKTVRVRLRRLEREGFIKYYQATPHIALLGMGVELATRFDAVNIPTKLNALRYAQQQPGMLEGLDFLGNSFVVSVAGPTGADAVATQKRIAHHCELDRYELGRRELSPPPGTLTPLDWRIVERMRYDGRAPLEEVAGALGITARVARYRLGRMTASGAVGIRPILDARHLGGATVFRLAVTAAASAREDVIGRIRREFAPSIWALRVPPSGPPLFDMFGFNLAEAENAVTRALDLPGVEACSVLILKEIIESPRDGWIDRGIAARAGRSGPTVSPPSAR